MYINITPMMSITDSIMAIEAAGAGDEVIIAPGTYKFRVFIAGGKNPLIKALDANNKPIFDYTGQNCDLYPGTLTTWLKRYGWVIQGSPVIESIIIKGARYSGSSGVSAGVFVGPDTMYAEPAPIASFPDHITLNGVEISDCDDGISGTAKLLELNGCKLYGNGLPGVITGRHNIYCQGGTLLVKNSTFDNAVSGSHINARAKALIVEDSTFGTFGAFPINVLTPKADMTNGVAFTQTATFRRCNVSGERNGDLGMSKAFALDNSNNYNGLRQELTLENVNYVGEAGNTGVVVAMYRGTGTTGMGLTVTGGSYSNYAKFLRLSTGEVPTSSFYTINVDPAFWDDSLPSGGTIPPVIPPPVIPPTNIPTYDPATQLRFHITWGQMAFTQGFAGWNIYISETTIYSITPTKVIPYTVGMTLETYVVMPIAPKYYVKVTPFNSLGIEGRGRATTVTTATALTENPPVTPSPPSTVSTAIR